METTKADSLNTELVDRVLWFDGDSTINEEGIRRLITCGESMMGIFVTEETPEIIQYNKLVGKKEELHKKEGIKQLKYDWLIPDEYKTIDVTNYVATKLMEQHITDELPARTQRVANELNLYEKLELIDVLRTLIFVINTLIENNVVWGVGRGSSVSSYVLYLIGVHDVDSFKYGLNIEEFLRTE